MIDDLAKQAGHAKSAPPRGSMTVTGLKRRGALPRPAKRIGNEACRNASRASNKFKGLDRAPCKHFKKVGGKGRL